MKMDKIVVDAPKQQNGGMVYEDEWNPEGRDIKVMDRMRRLPTESHLGVDCCAQKWNTSKSGGRRKNDDGRRRSN